MHSGRLKPSRSSSGGTKLADKTSEDPTKISGLLSILEKSVEIHVALIIYCFLLFFDICLELFDHSGVYDLAFAEPNVRITAVLAIKFVIIFVIFSIFISIFMPTIAVLTEGLIRPIAYSKPVTWLWLPGDDGGIRHMHEMWLSGYVHAYAIEEKAHETKEQYYLDLAKDAEQRDSDYQRTTRLLIAAFGFSVYNMLGHFSSLSLLQGIAVKSGEYGYIYVWMFICVFLVHSLRWLLLDNDWMYCPSIANEFLEKLQKNEEERRRFQMMRPVGRSLSVENSLGARFRRRSGS
jgi:hypothetical protein